MGEKINMFVVYAREDHDVKLGLLRHLKPFGDAYDLYIWHDDHIEPGQQWKPHIDSRLNQTDIFLLLVSVDFMNSEFIKHVEFKTAIDRHKADKSIVIPVIIDYCQWDIKFDLEDYTFNLSELQVLPDGGKPIGDWKTDEKAFNNVAAGVRKVILSIKNKREQEAIAAKSDQEEQKVAPVETTKEEETEKKEAPVIAKKDSPKNEVIQEPEPEKPKPPKQEPTPVKESGESGSTTPFMTKYKVPLMIVGGLLLIFVLWKVIGFGGDGNAESDAWENATTLNTTAAYEKYRKKYPNGTYYQAAKDSIDKITDTNDWREASSLNSKRAYEAYMKIHPEGLWISEAKKKITELDSLASIASSQNGSSSGGNERMQAEKSQELYNTVQAIYSKHKTAFRSKDCDTYKNLVRQLQTYTTDKTPVPAESASTVLYPKKISNPTIGDLAADRIFRVQKVFGRICR